jgi:hypothetical protein
MHLPSPFTMKESLLSNHEKQLEQYKLADKRQDEFERLNKRNLRGKA